MRGATRPQIVAIDGEQVEGQEEEPSRRNRRSIEVAAAARSSGRFLRSCTNRGAATRAVRDANVVRLSAALCAP